MNTKIDEIVPKMTQEPLLEKVNEIEEFAQDFEKESVENKSKVSDQISVDLQYEVELAKESNQKRQQSRIEELQAQLVKKEEQTETLMLKVDGLENELEKVNREVALKDAKISEFEKKGKTLSDESSKHLNVVKGLNEKIGRLQKQLQDQREATDAEKRAGMIRERDAETLRKDFYRLESELKTKNKRIDGLLKDIEKFKNSQKIKKSEPTTSDKEPKLKHLEEELRKAERQKMELFGVLRKQTNLIDTMRKQRATIENAYL